MRETPLVSNEIPGTPDRLVTVRYTFDDESEALETLRRPAEGEERVVRTFEPGTSESTARAFHAELMAHPEQIAEQEAMANAPLAPTMARGLQQDSTMHVTTQMLRATNKIDTARRGRFIERETATLQRWVAKANAGARRYRDFAGWTEQQIGECVQARSRMQDFRVFEEVS